MRDTGDVPDKRADTDRHSTTFKQPLLKHIALHFHPVLVLQPLSKLQVRHRESKRRTLNMALKPGSATLSLWKKEWSACARQKLTGWLSSRGRYIKRQLVWGSPGTHRTPLAPRCAATELSWQTSCLAGLTIKHKRGVSLSERDPCHLHYQQPMPIKTISAKCNRPTYLHWVSPLPTAYTAHTFVAGKYECN